MTNRLAALGESVSTRSLSTVSDTLAALTLETVRREARRLAPRSLSESDREDVEQVATLAALATLSDAPSGEAVRFAARRALSLTLRRWLDDETDGRETLSGSLSTDEDTPQAVRLTVLRGATPSGDASARTTDRDRLRESLRLAAQETDRDSLRIALRAVRSLPDPSGAGRPLTVESHAARLAGASLSGRSGVTFRTGLRETLDTLRESGSAALSRLSVEPGERLSSCRSLDRPERRGASPEVWSRSRSLAPNAPKRATREPLRETPGASPVVTLGSPLPVPWSPDYRAATVSGSMLAVRAHGGPWLDPRTLDALPVGSVESLATALLAPGLLPSLPAYVTTESDRSTDGFVSRLAGPGPVAAPSRRKSGRVGSTGPTVPVGSRSGSLTGGSPSRLAPALGTFTMPDREPVPMPTRSLDSATLSRLAERVERDAWLAARSLALGADPLTGDPLDGSTGAAYAGRLATLTERATLAARALHAHESRPTLSGPAPFIGPLTARAAYARGDRWEPVA